MTRPGTRHRRNCPDLSRTKGVQAVTRYRDWDGKVRQVKRHGATKGAARMNLAAAIRDRLVGHLRDRHQWRDEAEGARGCLVRPGEGSRSQPLDCSGLPRSPRQTDPSVAGELGLRELSVGVVERHLAAVKVTHGPSLAKTTRSVLSGMFTLACRYDAIATNLCRDVGRISVKPKRPPTALTIDELEAPAPVAELR